MIATKIVRGDELFVKYQGQTRPQPVYVELDCPSGVLLAAASGQIGNAVTSAVWHGHTLRWHVPALRADVANDLLARLAPQAKRIVAGYDVRWNGSNHVAWFTPDAERAKREIQEEVERVSRFHSADDIASEPWEPSEIFGVLGSKVVQAEELGITSATHDEELSAIADREVESAKAGDAALDRDDVFDYLQTLREAVAQSEVQ